MKVMVTGLDSVLVQERFYQLLLFNLEQLLTILDNQKDVLIIFLHYIHVFFFYNFDIQGPSLNSAKLIAMF